MTERILENIATHQERGSGWQFDEVVSFDIYIDPFEPAVGNSYIPLPPELPSKKAIIKVQNTEDDKCFKHSITTAVYTPKVHPERVTKKLKKNSEKFDWTGIDFPTPLDQIDRLERQNPSYAVFVFGYEGDKIRPLRPSKD